MRSIVDNLISASGYRAHTTSPSACPRIRLVRDTRPPHPAPNVRDDRETPLCSRARDGGVMDLICANREAIYFCENGWTGSISLIGFEKSAVWCRGSAPICAPLRRHSGMVRKHQTRNLEIPGSMLCIAPE
jgi:D-alanyl-D-alanine dipeptidase